MRSWGLGALFVVLAVCGGWLVTNSPSATAVILGLAVATIGMVTLGGWRALWVALIVLLFFSTSNQHQLVDAAYYPRYGAAVLLAAITWVSGSPNALRLEAAGIATQWLVKGLWVVSGIGLVSVAWSIDKSTTLLQALALASLAWLIHGLVTRRWQDRNTMTTDLGLAGLIFTGIFVACMIGSALGDVPAYPLGAPNAGRFRGYFENPQTLGILAVLAFLVLFGVWRETKQAIYFFALIVCLWAALLSESRTAQLGLGLALVWVLLRNRARVRHLIQLGVAAAVVTAADWIGLIPGHVLTSPFTRFTTEDGGTRFDNRELAWGQAIDAWKEHPLVGIGYSAGPTLFRDLRLEGLSRFDVDVVHNSYLQWFLETGLVGVIPMILVLAAPLWVVFRGRLSGLDTGLIAAVFAALVIQLTESAIFGTGSNYPFFFWPIVAAATLRTQNRPPDMGAQAAADHGSVVGHASSVM